jgi:REP element-mobilizing transposase RayT
MSIFYDPYAHTEKYHRNLPHWCQEGKMVFVTFRLADSIPADRLRQLQAERDLWKLNHPQMISPNHWLEYYRLFSDRVEGWLDDPVGECQLARPDCAEIMAKAMGHFDGTRYTLDHWVIMPNHVHVLLIVKDQYPMKDILHGWKSFTARPINTLCNRTGRLWQHESFDHLVRNPDQLKKYRAYIIENASKAPGQSRLSTHQAV